jgi:hypothetical protein
VADLPKFQPYNLEDAEEFMTRALTRGEDEYLRRVIPYEDGHFRAVFRPGYFVRQPGAIEPTKSQWNTFKKHLKRMNKLVFVFREHGTIDCEDGEPGCVYVDFGFFAELPPQRE